MLDTASTAAERHRRTTRVGICWLLRLGSRQHAAAVGSAADPRRVHTSVVVDGWLGNFADRVIFYRLAAIFIGVNFHLARVQYSTIYCRCR